MGFGGIRTLPCSQSVLSPSSTGERLLSSGKAYKRTLKGDPNQGRNDVRRAVKARYLGQPAPENHPLMVAKTYRCLGPGAGLSPDAAIFRGRSLFSVEQGLTQWLDPLPPHRVVDTEGRSKLPVRPAEPARLGRVAH